MKSRGWTALLRAIARPALFERGCASRPARSRGQRGEYSKGMRQKLGLAIALMKDARAILLDEPLAELDPAAANDLVAVLRETAAQSTALLISTHHIFRAENVATRIGIIRQGRMVDMLDPRRSVPVLAGFTIGRSNALFRNYQLDNPERLQRERIDLSFVAIVARCA